METSFDKLSYALGLSMGNNFKASGIESINIQDFADGVAAVYYGSQPKMTYDEAKAEIQRFFTELEAKQKAASEAMAAVNAKAGEDFLAENGKRVEVKTTASGLQYEVLKEGEGPQPTAADQVVVTIPASSSTAPSSIRAKNAAHPPHSASRRLSPDGSRHFSS